MAIRYHLYPHPDGLRLLGGDTGRLFPEADWLAKEQVRKKAYLAREQAIEEAQKERGAKRSEKRANEEIDQLARDQARRETYLAREKAIAEAQEARRLKAKKQPPE